MIINDDRGREFPTGFSVLLRALEKPILPLEELPTKKRILATFPFDGRTLRAWGTHRVHRRHHLRRIHNFVRSLPNRDLSPFFSLSLFLFLFPLSRGFLRFPPSSSSSSSSPRFLHEALHQVHHEALTVPKGIDLVVHVRSSWTLAFQFGSLVFDSRASNLETGCR